MRAPGTGRARPRVATYSVQNESCDHPLSAGTGPCAVHAAGPRPRRKGQGPFTREPLRHSRRPAPCTDFGPLRAPYRHRVVTQGAPLFPCVPFLLSDGTTVLAFISSIVLPSEDIFPSMCTYLRTARGSAGAGAAAAPPRASCTPAPAPAAPRALRSPQRYRWAHFGSRPVET